jgi:hypothetical protein
VDNSKQIFDPEDEGHPPEWASGILKVTEATLASWRALGRGPRFRKSGRRIEYTPRFIKEYQTQCERTPEPASVRRQRLGAESAA